MTNLNNISIMGRLTADMVLEYLNNGTAKGSFSIANNYGEKRDGKWEDYTSFIDVTLWGKTAENLKPYMKKGTTVAVQGRIRQDRWEKDGKKNSKICIIADNVYLCGGRGEGQGEQNNSGYGNHGTVNDSGNNGYNNGYGQQGGTNQNNGGYDPQGSFPEDIPF